MREGYPGIRFETIGAPCDLASAETLAADDPRQFQQRVRWQIGGYPRDRKGGDRGVDGWFNYEGSDPERGAVARSRPASSARGRAITSRPRWSAISAAGWRGTGTASACS